MKQNSQRVGIMGGTFDPVHNGHLQMAQNVRAYCDLAEIRLLPCGTPVHRGSALASAAQRIDMLQLAVADSDWLQVDARECRSMDPSYTYNSMADLRAESPQTVFFLLMGLDAFLALHTWHRWQDLVSLVHLVVVSRPGYTMYFDSLDPRLKAEAGGRLTTRVEDMLKQDAGRILLAPLPTPEISSTQVREALQKGSNTTALLPAAVAAYIRRNGLYQ